MIHCLALLSWSRSRGVVWALAGLLATACQSFTPVRECPAGQQEHGERCLPTPTIVFLQCVEAFRTAKIELDRSTRLAVDATAPGPGAAPIGGSLHRAKLDRESREYTELPDDGIDIAVAECRRQEEAERASRLAQALADAEDARAEMRTARAEAATATVKLDEIAASAEELERRLESSHAELETANATIAALDPCAAKVWDACAERASAAQDSGDEPAAARMFHAACDGGHVEACVSEGALLQAGQGSRRDPARAARIFAKACRADSARGCWYFGDALERGFGIATDDDRAARAYARACQLGEADGCEDARPREPTTASVVSTRHDQPDEPDAPAP